MEHVRQVWTQSALLIICLSLAACGYGPTGTREPLGIGDARMPAGSTAERAAPDREKIIVVGSGWIAPSGVAVDEKGDVYVSDYRLGEVKKISPPFTGRTHGKIRVAARGLDSPISVALDAKGNVYVVTGAGTILQITPAGVKNTVTTKIAAFGIAVDRSENVYAAGGVTKGVSAFYALYFMARKAGGGWKNPVKIPPSNISNAAAVALDGLDDLYAIVTPNGMSPVALKIKPNGKLILVGSGWQGGPSYLAIPIGCKASCPVYASDGNNVKKVAPPFTGRTHGKITIIGYGFSDPSGVAARGSDVYVIDSGNVQVKEVIP